MIKTIISLILIHGGYIATIAGILKNRSIEEQVWSAIQRGTNNPGNTWIYVGVAAILLGTLILILDLVQTAKKNKSKKY